MHRSYGVLAIGEMCPEQNKPCPLATLKRVRLIAPGDHSEKTIISGCNEKKLQHADDLNATQMKDFTPI